MLFRGHRSGVTNESKFTKSHCVTAAVKAARSESQNVPEISKRWLDVRADCKKDVSVDWYSLQSVPALVSGLSRHSQSLASRAGASEVVLFHRGNLPMDDAVRSTEEIDHGANVWQQDTGRREGTENG